MGPPGSEKLNPQPRTNLIGSCASKLTTTEALMLSWHQVPFLWMLRGGCAFCFSDVEESPGLRPRGQMDLTIGPQQLAWNVAFVLLHLVRWAFADPTGNDLQWHAGSGVGPACLWHVSLRIWVAKIFAGIPNHSCARFVSSLLSPYDNCMADRQEMAVARARLLSSRLTHSRCSGYGLSGYHVGMANLERHSFARFCCDVTSQWDSLWRGVTLFFPKIWTMIPLRSIFEVEILRLHALLEDSTAELTMMV